MSGLSWIGFLNRYPNPAAPTNSEDADTSLVMVFGSILALVVIIVPLLALKQVWNKASFLTSHWLTKLRIGHGQQKLPARSRECVRDKFKSDFNSIDESLSYRTLLENGGFG